MKKNDTIHGFRVEYEEKLPEISATLWRMTYEKNGADLIWLERTDDNKTFAIAFKTIPSDDTGVFHILEHSVLCGSEKYPVKEPFVELKKSSMATFLNAFTFSDKTMYPVSSRNEKDFLNLIDVYMDAVLHPLSVTDPHAFRQEGWHFELESSDSPLTCNGVVYNEMKGEYASYESVLFSELHRLIFPDTCYSYESGGHPESITSLTYENYLESHRRFYHPSNSRIILDGEMELDKVLEKLDSFLCEYDKLDVDADIPYQDPVSPEEKVSYYEIGSEESTEKKAILSKGFVFGDFHDTEKNLAVSVLSDVLCASNKSPLSKALIDANLAEEVYFSKCDGTQQIYVALIIRNAEEEKKSEIWTLVNSVLSNLADKGLDRKQLRSTISRMEFAIREKDFGFMPRGLVFAMSTLDSWLYGGDPAQNLCYDELFASLRKKIDEGWFEELLREIFLENDHTATLCLLPSKTLGEEKRKAEEKRLAEVKASLNDADIARVTEEFKTLRKKQEARDSAEAIARLPVLSICDIPEEGERIPQNITELDGITVLHQPIETDKIIYLSLYFSLADMTVEKLSKISFFSTLIGQTATEHYSSLELQSELQGSLGRFSASINTFAKVGQTKKAVPYLVVKIALLEQNKPDAVRLVEEVLLRSDFSDEGIVYNLLRQSRLDMEQNIAMSGDSYASLRVAASSSAKGVLDEAVGGISMLRLLQSAERSFEDKKSEIITELAAFLKTIFTKDRLTLSVTGELDEKWLSEIISAFPAAHMGKTAVYLPSPTCNEGFVIPADIGFAAKRANLNNLGADYSGASRVASQFLRFDYLWNEIRVKGGAYGIGMSAVPNGDVTLTTYRDPSPANSLCVFDKAGEALRSFCHGDSELEKYIISTIAAAEPLLTPQARGQLMNNMYFSGRTYKDGQKVRHEILNATKEDLALFSEKLDEVCSSAGVCVIGGKNVIDACTDILDSVETI